MLTHECRPLLSCLYSIVCIDTHVIGAEIACRRDTRAGAEFADTLVVPEYTRRSGAASLGAPVPKRTVGPITPRA